MSAPSPTFRWPRFLVAFIAAPLLFTLLTFWVFIPIYALIFGGPLYLIAGLPLAAWHLRRHPLRTDRVLLMAQACQLLQIPVFTAVALYTGQHSIFNALPVFLIFGAIFAALWSATFVLLYRLLAHAERPSPEKEPPHVHP